jgi:hypothetical protein
MRAAGYTVNETDAFEDDVTVTFSPARALTLFQSHSHVLAEYAR